MQVQRAAPRLTIFYHVYDTLHKGAPQTAPSELAGGAERHDVEHFGIGFAVRHEKFCGFVALWFEGFLFIECIAAGVATGGGHGGGEEGSHDATHNSLPD